MTKHSITKQIITTLSIIILLSLANACLSASIFHGKKQPTHAKGDNAVVISTAFAKKVDWSARVTVLGTATAVQAVDVSAGVEGIVSKIAFKSGQHVTAGQLLVTLNHDDLRAQLKFDQAALTLAKDDYQRYLKLFQQGLISKGDATLDKNKAMVLQAQATLHQDQALLAQKSDSGSLCGACGYSSSQLRAVYFTG